MLQGRNFFVIFIFFKSIYLVPPAPITPSCPNPLYVQLYMAVLFQDLVKGTNPVFLCIVACTGQVTFYKETEQHGHVYLVGLQLGDSLFFVPEPRMGELTRLFNFNTDPSPRCTVPKSINQIINHITNQSINQPINQLHIQIINHLINQSINQSIDQLFNQSICY